MNSVFYLLLHPNKLLSIPYPANTRWIRQWWSDLNSALKFVQIRLFTTMNAITFDNATTSPSPSSGLNIYAQLSPTFYLCLVIYDAIIALATSLGNFLLLVVIYRDPLRCLRTPTTSLIANLGVADFFVGAFLGFGRTVEMYFLCKGHQEPQYLNTFPIFHRSTGYVCGSLFHNGDVLGSFCSSNRPHELQEQNNNKESEDVHSINLAKCVIFGRFTRRWC